MSGQELGHAQPMPGDADYDSHRSEWVSMWRSDVAERTKVARDDGSDMLLLLKAHIDACDACKAQNGSEIDPNSPPDPPVSGCTNSRGCTCTFVSRLIVS